MTKFVRHKLIVMVVQRYRYNYEAEIELKMLKKIIRGHSLFLIDCPNVQQYFMLYAAWTVHMKNSTSILDNDDYDVK